MLLIRHMAFGGEYISKQVSIVHVLVHSQSGVCQQGLNAVNQWIDEYTRLFMYVLFKLIIISRITQKGEYCGDPL